MDHFLIFSVTEPSAFFPYTIFGLIATILPLINVALSLLYWIICPPGIIPVALNCFKSLSVNISDFVVSFSFLFAATCVVAVPVAFAFFEP